MSHFAVIDTETTWHDEVMSIGVVVADSEKFQLIDKKYYILTPFKNHGGMYAHALYVGGMKPDLECARETALDDLIQFLASYDVDAIFAYNAAFDFRHLPEMRHLSWHDIMRLAAYKQHNPKITSRHECCATGKLKRGYGVESIYRMLSGNDGYCEKHNALTDAMDEMEIMRLLGFGLDRYEVARIG